jgi:hypothetical protein
VIHQALTHVPRHGNSWGGDELKPLVGENDKISFGSKTEKGIANDRHIKQKITADSETPAAPH